MNNYILEDEIDETESNQILDHDKPLFDFKIQKIIQLAQINNIDMSTPSLLARTDAEMMRNFGIKTYFSYIFATLMGKGSGDKILN